MGEWTVYDVRLNEVVQEYPENPHGLADAKQQLSFEVTEISRCEGGEWTVAVEYTTLDRTKRREGQPIKKWNNKLFVTIFVKIDPDLGDIYWNVYIRR